MRSTQSWMQYTISWGHLRLIVRSPPTKTWYNKKRLMRCTSYCLLLSYDDPYKQLLSVLNNRYWYILNCFSDPPYGKQQYIWVVNFIGNPEYWFLRRRFRHFFMLKMSTRHRFQEKFRTYKRPSRFKKDCWSSSRALRFLMIVRWGLYSCKFEIFYYSCELMCYKSVVAKH